MTPHLQATTNESAVQATHPAHLVAMLLTYVPLDEWIPQGVDRDSEDASAGWFLAH